MQSTDLGIPIYLNQQIVFDLLAILDDGFSQISTIKTSSSDSEISKHGIGASIGASNVFALLGISFSGERGKEQSAQAQQEMSQEKVHTPTSLFAKLRSRLRDLELLHQIDVDVSLDDIQSGDFVEFKAVLRKNPLIETIETFKQFMEMAVLFEGGDITPQNPKQRKGQGRQNQQANSNALILKQMDGMLTALNHSDSLELVGELIGAEHVKAVLTTRPDFFSQGGSTEIIDGEFNVLGKVIRVVKTESDESVNLLRKTAFGKFQFEQFSEAFAGLNAIGMRSGELVTEIHGPAVLVIPVAVFT